MHRFDYTQVANSAVRSFFPQHRTLPPTPPPDTIHGGAAHIQKMELGNILNTKTSANAVTGTPLPFTMQNTMQPEMQAPQQPQPQYPPPPFLNGRIKSETGSDRTASPHPVDPRYPAPPQQPLPAYPPMPNNYGTDMRYPSPSASAMGVPMPMPNGYPPGGQADNPYAPPQPSAEQNAQQPGGRSSNENGPPKAFACSTCSKGFARRSDLARHGKMNFVSHFLTSGCVLTGSPTRRANPQRSSASRLRLPQLWEAIHSKIRFDSPSAGSHWRKASHVRTLRQGLFFSLSSHGKNVADGPKKKK